MIRRYSELARIESFQERFEYLALKGRVGSQTFGFDRYLNQRFYASRQWKHVRSQVIARDHGCDLGVEGYEIYTDLYIHHMNPMTAEDLIQGRPEVVDPDFLITTTHNTHNAIHYGDERLLPRLLVARKPGDTKLW